MLVCLEDAFFGVVRPVFPVTALVDVAMVEDIVLLPEVDDKLVAEVMDVCMVDCKVVDVA